MYAFCVCALFIALLLPCLEMCGYPFNSGQKKIHLPGTKWRMTEIRNSLNTKRGNKNQS